MPAHGWPARTAAAVLAGACLAGASDLPREVPVSSEPVALNDGDPGVAYCGKLAYRGGLVLRSDDKRFGGFSGLSVSADGERVTAISDEGRWLTANLRYGDDGRLTGFEDARLDLMLTPQGKSLPDKAEQDAESLTVLGDSSFLVGFEHHHRLWRYRLPGGPAEVYPSPGDLPKTPANGGIESLAALPDGRVLAITEYRAEKAGLRGWIGVDGKWKPLWYPLVGAFRPSDACALPGGDVLVLERAYNRERGIVSVRFVRLEAQGLKGNVRLQGSTLAILEPPLILDNFEGLACRAGQDGETLIYVLSDNNFSAVQRTLLLHFALR
jgi:hypothetical protein